MSPIPTTPPTVPPTIAPMLGPDEELGSETVDEDDSLGEADEFADVDDGDDEEAGRELVEVLLLEAERDDSG